ncbi:MAG TPA: M23 family metallopeptidase [Longimicrobium sp.]|jgi:murein DD-endopeptidase MepM/ murein hydrolase activator NlpD
MTPLRRRARVRAVFPRGAARLAAAALLLPLAACYPRSELATSPQPRYERERPAPERRERTEAPRPEAYVAPGASLAIPVRGVRPEQLEDSYYAARSGGRVHHAIDIMAPGGTPVLAAADGTILKLRQSSNGGTTIYQLDPDGRTVYYYAHLQRYAAGLREGLPVLRGQVIAYVGDTGNAGAGNYHLHFSVSTVPDPTRWWDGVNTNPYPLLAGSFAFRAGRTSMSSGQQ